MSGADMAYSIASCKQRFIALLADVFILEAFRWLVTLPFSMKTDAGIGEMMETLLRGEAHSVRELAFAVLAQLVIVTALWTFYFVYFPGASGQTPGKKLMRIQIIRQNGQPLDYKTAFTRFTWESVSASCFLLGFVWALFNENRQTWHDKMAHTLVVRQAIL